MDGADQLAALSRALKAAGDKGLQRELSKAIGAAARPFRERLRSLARETLPNRGGLADLAASRVVPRVRRAASSRASGVRLVATGKKGLKSLRQLDAGGVRHPVFGNRDAWVAQSVAPGFWTQATEELEPQVRGQVLAAMDAVAKKIEGSV